MTNHSHKPNNNQYAKYSIPASNDISLIANYNNYLSFYKRHDSKRMVIFNVF